MSRHFLLLVLLMLSFIGGMVAFGAAQAQAPIKGLLISPKRVVFEKGDRVKEIRLVNRGDQVQKYRVSIINRKMLPNGQLVPADDPAEGEFFAKKHVRYGPRQVELAPKSAQSIRIMSRLPANAPDGEYRSHVLIQEIPDASAAESVQGNQPASGVGVNVRAIFGISLPIFLRKGDLTASATLSDPKIIKEDDATYVQFKINRTGNKSVFGTAKVFAGQENIAILKGVAVYLSAASRTLMIEIPEKHANRLHKQSLRITYGAVEPEENAPETELSFTP